jgi:hypothetical protein
MTFRRFVLLLAVVTALFPLLHPAHAHASAGAIHFFLGQKFMDEDDWAPVEDQFEIGIDAAFGGNDWPVWINLGLLGSSAQEELGGGVEVEGSTAEFTAGINKTWTGGQFRPYVAGGIAFVTVDVETRDESVTIEDGHDAAVGLYLQGGGYWRLGSSFNLGGMLRLTMADGDVFGGEFQGGGVHLGLTLGYGWPKQQH